MTRRQVGPQWTSVDIKNHLQLAYGVFGIIQADEKCMVLMWMIWLLMSIIVLYIPIITIGYMSVSVVSCRWTMRTRWVYNRDGMSLHIYTDSLLHVYFERLLNWAIKVRVYSPRQREAGGNNLKYDAIHSQKHIVMTSYFNTSKVRCSLNSLTGFAFASNLTN